LLLSALLPRSCLTRQLTSWAMTCSRCDLHRSVMTRECISTANLAGCGCVKQPQQQGLQSCTNRGVCAVWILRPQY
jgi:hypothetical protein